MSDDRRPSHLFTKTDRPTRKLRIYPVPQLLDFLLYMARNLGLLVSKSCYQHWGVRWTDLKKIRWWIFPLSDFIRLGLTAGEKLAKERRNSSSFFDYLDAVPIAEKNCDGAAIRSASICVWNMEKYDDRKEGRKERVCSRDATQWTRCQGRVSIAFATSRGGEEKRERQQQMRHCVTLEMICQFHSNFNFIQRLWVASRPALQWTNRCHRRCCRRCPAGQCWW